MPVSALAKYRRTRAAGGPWSLAGCRRRDYGGAVVIPALAEGPHLLGTLRSLARNPPELLRRFVIILVINHRPQACAEDQADNRATLARLALGWPHLPTLELAWVDAASPGLELPSTGGVGLARKIGLDLALDRLDWTRRPLLVCLDADTLVEENYLGALLGHFADTEPGGATLPFRHQLAATPAGQAAIDLYELYLRHYVLGLELARSPYAFHTVGSALACRAEAYVRAGGMNRRVAGEDFYFLQQLAKTCGVAPLGGTTVFPSSRASARVPFGTGASMTRLTAGEVAAVRFFPVECFRLLGAWLALAQDHRESPPAKVLRTAAELSPALASYLETAGLPIVWLQLQAQHRTALRFAAAFHIWFDGLKTLRLIHHLCAGPLERVGPEIALPPLLLQAGWIETRGQSFLEAMRIHQGAG